MKVLIDSIKKFQTRTVTGFCNRDIIMHNDCRNSLSGTETHEHS